MLAIPNSQGIAYTVENGAARRRKGKERKSFWLMDGQGWEFLSDSKASGNRKELEG